MKKLFLALALVIGINTMSNAQDVGQCWVGGSLGFTSVKPKGSESSTSFKILPEFGYVVSENMGIGLQIGYQEADNFNSIGSHPLFGFGRSWGEDLNAFIVAPFVRYTFLKGDIGGMFLDTGVSYTTGEYQVEGQNGMTDIKFNTIDAGIRPGVAISVSDKVSLTGKFGFIGYSTMKQGDSKTNAFGANFDMSQFLFGASVVF